MLGRRGYPQPDAARDGSKLPPAAAPVTPAGRGDYHDGSCVEESETTVDPACPGDRWIRQYHRAPHARMRLVCLPHAGGAANFFRPVSAALLLDVEVLAVQYPGRQDRLLEPLIGTVEELADAVFGVLGPWLSGPGSAPALFGHSMGATVAFELARRMEAAGVAPARLVLSGARAPSRPRPGPPVRRTDDELVAQIVGLGGTEDGLLADSELAALVLPAIRSDYHAIDTYVGSPTATVSCPITVFTGAGDPEVTDGEADGWAVHTEAAFDRHHFPGGHFYLTAHQDDFLTRLAAVMRS
jgi:surfactin synthase thioesterase subunit